MKRVWVFVVLAVTSTMPGHAAGISAVLFHVNGDMSSFGVTGDFKISANGKLVFFRSESTNLVPGDTNGVIYIFVKNVLTGEISRVNTDANGVQANGCSDSDLLSDGGSFVAAA